ncbi:MAG: protocatechuate 3,4-dioxygenase [Woeseiaceae bacterium]|nr:protocatechuate 3,4-dioxygenase [Woeseiaceae bacterium]
MKISRRTIARQLGLLLGGASILGSGVARALVKTPAQTEGPFYPPEPHGETDVDLTMLEGHTERATGDVILVRGRVTDTDGNPLANARVDIWQANHYGRYDHPRDPNPAPLDPNFQGIGVMHTDAGGRYGFKTIRPAPYAISDTQTRPRHIHFKVSHPDRQDVTTQMYFEGDPLIEGDIVMANTPEDKRHLLISKTETDADSGLPLHQFDIALA